jgi:hypothetical protein
MMNFVLRILIFIGLIISMVTRSEDILLIESTISGSSEQPKVLTIIPWKEPKLPEYLGEEVKGIGEALDVFQIIDRNTFNRERVYISSTRKKALTTF